MEITPEIIATKIFEYRKVKSMTYGYYYEDPRPGNYKILEKSELPTFLESEWTGPLLVKAAGIGGEYKLSFRQIYVGSREAGSRYLEIKYTFDIWGKDSFPKTVSDFRLNYAIAGAILEAIGE